MEILKIYISIYIYIYKYNLLDENHGIQTRHVLYWFFHFITQDMRILRCDYQLPYSEFNAFCFVWYLLGPCLGLSSTWCIKSQKTSPMVSIFSVCLETAYLVFCWKRIKNILVSWKKKKKKKEKRERNKRGKSNVSKSYT